MRAAQKRTFSLPAEQAQYVDRLVKSGAYATPSEVVCAGLRALQDREDTIERWLQEEVAPAYDAMEADPSRGLSANQVMQAVRERQAARVKKPKRRA